MDEIGPSGAKARNRELINAIRGLDKTGPGDNGQSIEHIWGLITSNKSANFYAAEESVLRWLLKSMKATTDTGETLRRYPLTWRILGCTFQRIPLFSLAKSLADRKFMGILQQTLKAIAKNRPNQRGVVENGKRKRTVTPMFGLEALSTCEGSLLTAQSLLDALRILFDRLEGVSQLTTHDKMGAEHIKALFSQPAVEMVSYVAPILSLCDISITSDVELGDSLGNWVHILSSVWELRLQGHADATELALVLSRPAFTLLGKLTSPGDGANLSMDIPVRERWTRQMQSFLHRNLLLPAKSSFLLRGDTETPTQVLAISKPIAPIAVPVFFNLATTTPRVFAGTKSAKSEKDWTELIFSLGLRQLRHLEAEVASPALEATLRGAISQGAQVSLEDLRFVCNRFAFTSEATNWRLVSLVAQLDPDVFLLSEEGSRIFDKAASQLLQGPSGSGSEKSEDDIGRFLDSLIKGYEDARDLVSFLKKWFHLLASCDPAAVASSATRPLWFATVITRNPRLLQGIEKSVTPKQLMGVLEWVGEEGLDNPNSVLVFLDTITRSIQSEEFVDPLGPKIFGLVENIWQQLDRVVPDIQGLRWSIMAKISSWAEPAELARVLHSIQAEATKALSKGDLKTPDTHRAFQCVSELWLASYPDGPEQSNLAGLLTNFTERLARSFSQLKSPDDPVWNPRQIQVDGFATLHSPPTIAMGAYVDYILGVATRIAPLLLRQSDSLPTFLQSVLALDSYNTPAGNPQELDSALGALISNDNVAYDAPSSKSLLDFIIGTLEQTPKRTPWTDTRGATALRALSSVPDDLMSRSQRERIMNILHGQRRNMKDRVDKVPRPTWNVVLGLMIKMMRRPTFYADMAFEDLLSLADHMAPSTGTLDSESYLSTARLLSELAVSTIRQMNEHFSEWGLNYFKQAKAQVGKGKVSVSNMFRMPIFQAVVASLSPSVHFEGIDAPFNLQELQDQLLAAIERKLASYASRRPSLSHDRTSWSEINELLLALDAAEGLLAKPAFPGFTVDAVALEEASQEAIAKGYLRGWRLRAFLMKYFPDQIAETKPTDFEKLVLSTDTAAGGVDVIDAIPDPVSASNGHHIIISCVDATLAHLDRSGKLAYIKTLIDKANAGTRAEGQLVALHQACSQMTDDPRLSDNSGLFDLSAAHSRLTKLLTKLSSVNEVCKAIDVLCLLLDQRASSMTQWNAESTLAAVAVVSSDKAAVDISSSPGVFVGLCKLVGVIIRRHRLRVEDHYHILLTAMEPMLRALAYKSSRTKGEAILKAKHAGMYSRLITLVTEPSAASVSRAQHVSALDSATDAAKRTAGRHMYMILMLYVKLQLEVDVSHDVRQALEPGMNSIFNVTPPEVRKILNDAMDASGRAILREMFKRYTQFGKWSGV